MNWSDIMAFIDQKSALLWAAAGGGAMRALILREPFLATISGVIVGLISAIAFTESVCAYFSLTSASMHTAVAVLISYSADFLLRGCTTLLRRWANNPKLPDWKAK